MTDTDDWQRLGTVMRERRRWLHLTQAKVAERDGPSTSTQRSLEKALADSYHPDTLDDADFGLGWPRGTALRILRGTLPESGRYESLDEWLESVVTFPDLRLDYEPVRPPSDPVSFVADRGPDDRSPEISDEELEQKIKEGLDAMAELRRRHGG